MQIQVSELIVRYMEKLGIDTIFGMPGAHILPVYDSLYDSHIQSVLAKHEQGAAFMACGYSRASGRISACITTAGPGATNLVTGIANAYADKQPVLVITGETPTYVFGKGGLQESSGEGGSIDQTALFDSITLYSRVIERTDYLANVLNQASRILLSENAGPVLLSLPYNLQKEMVDSSILDQVYFGDKKTLTCLQQPGQPQPIHPQIQPRIQQFADLLARSSQPVIISGYGCIRSGAQDAITRLSEKFNIPVCSSLKGKGAIDESSPLSLGSLGVTSSGYAYDYIVNRADLIVVLGASFNERTSYPWNEKLLTDKQIIQVDINEAHLNKVFQADLCLHADIRQTLDAVLDNINGAAVDKKQLDDIDDYKHRIELRASKNGEAIFQAEFSLVKAFFEKMNSHFREGISVFDDNIIFAQNLLRVSGNNRFYPNSGISSLGHAIPAAIGAQFAEKTSMFAIIGDGGFQMCCMEIMTAVNYDIPLTIILFNNSSMGLIRKNQIQSYDKRFIDCDFINPDYASLAKSFGINHVRIQSEDELQPVFDNTDFTNAINLVEIIIDKNAFPNYSSRR